MGKSSKRKLDAATRRRLSIERLETRIVLSATNLLADAIDVTAEVEDRFDMGDRPAFITLLFESLDTNALGTSANRFENQPEFAAEFEYLQTGSVDRTAFRPESIEVPTDFASLSSLPYGAGAGGDHSHWPGQLIRDPSPIGELLQTPDALLVSIVDSNDAHLEFGTLDRLAPFTVFSDTADSSARATDSPDRSELFERRSKIDAEERSEQTMPDGTNERERRFVDRLGEGGLVDIGFDRPELSVANRDRIFETLGGQVREGLRDSVPNERPEQSLSHATNIGDELSSRTDQTVAVPRAAEVSSQQVVGGLLELTSQEPIALRDLSAGQQLYAATIDQTVSLPRQTHDSKESPEFKFKTWLDAATRGHVVSFSAKWLGDESLANQVQQADDGSVELDTNLAEQPKTVRRGFTDTHPSDGTWWHEAPRHANESFWLEFSDEIESRLVTNATHQPHSEIGESDAETHVADSNTEFDGAEGGMIELIATAQPNTRQPSPQPANRSDVPREMPEKVRMDTGVGMFQVFEIATAPQGSTNESELITNDIDRPFETTSVNGPDATPPAERAAAISDVSDSELIRAASLPTLLAAASLLIDRRQQSDDDLFNARRGDR